jgi:4-amino-4-deoxy-L-arabinose transferase-like glycosyltransferase
MPPKLAAFVERHPPGRGACQSNRSGLDWSFDVPSSDAIHMPFAPGPTLQGRLAPAAEAPIADPLSAPAPVRDRPPLRAGLLVLLVAACFVPRALMAWRIQTSCVDGVVYFRLAGELEQQRLDKNDGGHLQIGTYPLALATLHRLGLDWEQAAEGYGVFLSTLAVLPLFGWARRQFDDRIAIVSCLFYAAHPKLIEWSPEAVREPSFWFFFLLGLYLLWRATAEVDWRFFVAGGVATAVAGLTRFEGWFLLFPFVGWSTLRFFRLRTDRALLSRGFMAGVAAVPVVLWTFGLMMPGDGWRQLRVEPIERAGTWLSSWADDEPSPVDSPAVTEMRRAAVAAQAAAAAPANEQGTRADVPRPADLESTEHWTIWATLTTFVRTCERGLTPLFAIFMFGGYFSRLRLFNRADSLPILLVVLAVAAGIWVHVWYAHLASSRYVLTIVLVSTRSAAFGLLDFARFAAGGLARRWSQARVAIPAGLAALVVLAGSFDALSSDFHSRETLADLGKWIRASYGESCTVVGSESQLLLVGFYAHATAHQFPSELARDQLPIWIAQVKPDVVVISKRKQAAAEYQPILDRSTQLGLELVPTEQLPGDTRNIVVLARRRPGEAALRQAARVPDAGR